MYYERETEMAEDLEIEQEYLTPREVMNLLYIGKNTFYRLVNTGALPAFRVGKQWRVHCEALRRFITMKG